MKHTMKRLVGAAVALTLLGSTAATADNFRLTASSSHPPVIPWVKVLKDFVVPETAKRAEELGHSIRWNEAYAGALYNFKNTLEGVQDGLGDVGWVGSLWEPNKLPLQNMTFSTPFVTTNTVLNAKIAADMYENIPAMKQAFADYNQVYLGPTASDDIVLITKEPITSLADLEGLKIYAPGAASTWLQGTGAIGVDAGLPVMYNGIKTGVTDGAMVPTIGILPFKLHEVAPHVTRIGFGGGVIGALTINKNTYDRMPPEMQQMMHEIGAQYGAMVAKGATQVSGLMMNKLLPEAGATVTTLSEADQKTWAAGLPDLAGAWVERVEAKGLPGSEALSFYMDAVRASGETPIRNWDQ